MTTLHERALILAREIAADSLCRREAWLPGVKAGIHKEIIGGDHDNEPLVQSALAAILRTSELAADYVHEYGASDTIGNYETAEGLREAFHLKKATTHD